MSGNDPQYLKDLLQEKLDYYGDEPIKKDDPWRFDAEEFEQNTGVKGIAKTYLLPDGMTSIELANVLVDMRNAFMPVRAVKFLLEWNELPKEISPLIDAEWQKVVREHGPKLNALLLQLEELNPELKVIDRDPANFQQTFDVVMGVICRFNPQDIAWYVGGNTGRQSHGDPQWARRHDKIKELTDNAPCRFVMSPSTQITVIDQLNKASGRDKRPGWTWPPFS